MQCLPLQFVGAQRWLFGTPKVEGGDASFAASLAVLDKELAVSPTGFVAWTDGPSVADLLLLPEIDQSTEECFDYFDLSPYASIQAWLGKMRAALPEAYPANFAVATDFAKSR